VGRHHRGNRGQEQPGELTADERAELRRLRREAVELRSEVEIQRQILLKTAAWLAQEMDEGPGGPGA
jgi:transposase-like protein